MEFPFSYGGSAQLQKKAQSWRASSSFNTAIITHLCAYKTLQLTYREQLVWICGLIDVTFRHGAIEHRRQLIEILTSGKKKKREKGWEKQQHGGIKKNGKMKRGNSNLGPRQGIRISLFPSAYYNIYTPTQQMVIFNGAPSCQKKHANGSHTYAQNLLHRKSLASHRISAAGVDARDPHATARVTNAFVIQSHQAFLH